MNPSDEDRAVFPLPKTRIEGEIDIEPAQVVVQADCSTIGGEGPDQWLQTPAADWTTSAHMNANFQITTVARNVLWNHDFAAYRMVYPDTTGAFTPADLAVDVYPTGTDHCHSNGNYLWFQPGQICLNPGKPQFNGWRIPIHEYGHFHFHTYGWDHGLWRHGCTYHATHEGAADAFVVLTDELLHHAPTASDTDITTRFLQGPGAGSCRTYVPEDPEEELGEEARQCPEAATAGRRRLGYRGVCEGGAARKPQDHSYQFGMAISQIVWSLVNNRRCAWPTTGDCAPVKILDRSTWLGKDTRSALALITRAAFESAIRAEQGHPLDFARVMSWYLGFYGVATGLSNNELESIRLAFQEVSQPAFPHGF